MPQLQHSSRTAFTALGTFTFSFQLFSSKSQSSRKISQTVSKTTDSLRHRASSAIMNTLRHADAQVQTATHPAGTTRWRMQRYNPMNRLRWKKNKVTHPVGYQKAKTRARFNYINPLFYIRRIKRNLTGAGHRTRTTTVY